MFVFVLAVVFKLCTIQFVQGDAYRALAEKSRSKNFEIPANRGNVYSADGSLLATSIPKYDIRIDAIKIGMLGDAQIIDCVAQSISGLDCPVVLDPVMVAKGGDRLLQQEAVSALRSLLPQATLITPNLPEAADILDCDEASTTREMQAQAQALLDLGPEAVLLKGGHLGGADSPDLLLTRKGGEEVWFKSPRVATKNTHGTGCTYASALATYLGAGLALEEAARRAKAYISASIAAADQLHVGSGHGPVHHFHFLKDSTQ